MTSPYYTPKEIAILKRQLKENSERAREAARRAGVELHPRVAAIRAASKGFTVTEVGIIPDD